MYYIKKTKGDLYLHDTVMENAFINELMPNAPGDYVKVYLYGLMYAQAHFQMNDKLISRELDLLESDVKKAWRYWADLDIIELKKNKEGSFDIIFKSVKEQFFGMGGEDEASFISYSIEDGNANDEELSKDNNGIALNTSDTFNQASNFNKASNIDSLNSDNINDIDNFEDSTYHIYEEEHSNTIEEISYDEDEKSNRLKEFMTSVENFLERPLDTSEIKILLDFIQERDVSKEFILYAFNYSKERNKNNFRYVKKIIENWLNEGLRTPMEVESNLAKFSERNQVYKEIFKYLGFINRQPTEPESKMMDKWFDEYGFNIDKVLEACSKTTGISTPNLNYVNKVLENWYSDAKKTGHNVNANKPVSQKVLDEYFEYLRNLAKKEQNERTEEVYNIVPEIKIIDDEINRLGIKMSRGILNNDINENKDLAEKIGNLEDQRAILLLDNNKDIDYTNIRYLCSKCQDTGMTDGGACSCVKERREEAEYWDKERSVLI